MLLIDIGNTCLEWRLLGAKGVQHGQQLRSQPLPDWPEKVTKVVVASVSAAADIQQQLAQKYAEKLVWVDAPIVTYPHFTHCYANPSRMGVDRWLAMIGARKHQQGALLVVDAGTALTVDFVSALNEHQGGYIVPGLRMAQEVLFQNTDKVKPFADERSEEFFRLGKTTVQCVEHGVQRQQLALLQVLRNDYPGYQCLVTGGDGQRLAEHLALEYYGNLVLDGLEVLCVGYL